MTIRTTLKVSCLSFVRSDEAKAKGVTLKAPREGDAGFDLPSLEDVEVPPKSFCVLRTGIHLAIPLGWYGQVRDRSSIALKGGAVTAGVIDSGYRGEVKVAFHNLSNEPIRFATGDKIAQCIVIPHLDGTECFEAEELDKLGTTKRGVAGFGSTGK